MSKKVLVVYYTQTGQLRDIVYSLAQPLTTDDDIRVFYEELKPKPPFPFPWTSDAFFQTMPESVMGVPCELEPLSVTGQEGFDLIVIAWQPWYLSPSIPIHAFFQHETARRLISGKPVITVIGCRNMWVMAQERVKKYITAAQGCLVGNIVLSDKAPNLISVISVIRWMFLGRKERYLKVIPPAGIAPDDIAGTVRFGEQIKPALLNADFIDLQSKLVTAGAVDVRPGLVMIEKRGIIFFRLWAAFIRRKGSYGIKARIYRVRLFKYYLITMLYLVSPFASLLYQLTRPFRLQTIKKQISLYQSN